MTDFLEQILARSYAPALDIRPRPVAHFETPTDAQPSTFEDAVELPSAQPDIPFREESQPVFALPPERRGFSTPAAPRLPHEALSASNPAQPDIPVQEHPLPPTEPPWRETPFIQPVREQKQNVSPAAATTSLPPPSPERESLRPAPVVIQNISVRPRAEAFAGEPFPQAATEPLRSAPSARQTTVRVQIGRIEISAPPPAPAPHVRAPVTDRRPPATLKPAHSLDEYLRRRNGGRS